MMYRSRSVRRAVGLVALAVVAAACSSTAPQATPSASPAVSSGLPAEAILPPGAHVNKKGQVISKEGKVIGTAEEFGLTEDGSGTSSDAGGGTTTGGGSAAGGASSGGGVASSAPGITSTEITIGLAYYDDADALYRSIGIDYESGPQRRQWEALIDDLNEHGGIAGLKVRPVYYLYSATSNKTWAQYSQEACAKFTQDNHVFAALWDFQVENFPACMQEAGASVVSYAHTAGWTDERIFSRYPTYIAPFHMDLNTMSTSLVDGLVKQNYFAKDAKLGLVTFDRPAHEYALQESLLPALERHGLELSEIARLHFPESTSDLSQTSSEATNAAIRFKTLGITHVMMLDAGAVISIFFTRAAENQAYRPTYGFTSQSGGQALADILGPDARNQLHGARMVGWLPLGDVRDEDDPTRKNETRRRCFKVMREHGVPEGTGAASFCDTMWFFKAAVEAGGSPITRNSFLSGVARLRGSYSPAYTFATQVSASRHDGVGAVAGASFFDECTCFRYTSQPYGIPN